MNLTKQRNLTLPSKVFSLLTSHLTVNSETTTEPSQVLVLGTNQYFFRDWGIELFILATVGTYEYWEMAHLNDRVVYLFN